MADSGFHTIVHWATASAGTVVLALALVQPAFAAHGGGFRRPGNGGAFAARAQLRAQRGGAARIDAAAPGTSLWRISDDARGSPRNGENNVSMRAGSLRADIARYNEEHAVNHFTPRQPDQRSSPRFPGSWFFRN
jgi:hypothetical protein